MRTRTRLLIGAVLGLVTGILLGWIVLPLEYVDTDPSSLRADFRTDYVLMTGEAYEGEGDILLAQMRLAALGPQPPAQIVAQAIAYAEENDYGEPDLEILNNLASATDLSKKQVAAVLEALAAEIKKNLGSRGPGAFTIPGLLKIEKKKVPARPAKKGVPNPFRPGELMDVAARPAYNKVKVRPLKNLKDMV